MSDAWEDSMYENTKEKIGILDLPLSLSPIMPFWTRPISFAAWRARSNREVELRNFVLSPLLGLPREIRDQIWEYALVEDEPVRMFADLCTWKEKQFGEDNQTLGGLLSTNIAILANMGFPLDEDETENATENYTFDRDGKRYINFFRPLRTCNRAVGLFTVSRAIHRECMLTLYKHTHFIFPDVYGFVGLDAFFKTVGHRSLAHLRKLTVHLPPWHFPRPMDHERSNLIFKSARGLGLRCLGLKHRDRLLSSFQRTAAQICRLNPGLQQLDLIISPYVSKYFEADIAPGDNTDPALCDAAVKVVDKHRNPKYVTRLDAEEFYLEKLSDLAPRLKVRFVALEFKTEDSTCLAEDQKVKYWNQVREKCDKYGFTYLKVRSKKEWDQLY